VYAGFGQGGVFLDFFKYTVSSNTWQRLDDFEGPARYGAVGYSEQDGGIVLAGTGFEPGVGPTNLRDAWRFSAVTGTGALLRAAGLPSNVGVEAAGWI
jgi:N-acetylneuraminic acid mutarotase